MWVKINVYLKKNFLVQVSTTHDVNWSNILQTSMKREVDISLVDITWYTIISSYNIWSKISCACEQLFLIFCLVFRWLSIWYTHVISKNHWKPGIKFSTLKMTIMFNCQLYQPACSYLFFDVNSFSHDFSNWICTSFKYKCVTGLFWLGLERQAKWQLKL